MGFQEIFVCLAFIGYAHSQIRYNICVPSTEPLLCTNLERDGSQVSCRSMPTRIDCALEMARGTAHVGYFSEEELLLLAQRQPNNHRVIASVRNADRQSQYAFEGVVVVPNSHTGGFDGLKGGRYCHPGFGATDIRWSPRVLRTLENLATRNERCPSEVNRKTAEELEVETLSNFFAAACRPGPWSFNTTTDAALKARYPNLCSMCTANGVCAGYSTDAAVNIAGVSNSNSHIQALDCLIRNGTVAFTAWTYVQQFFQTRNPEAANLYSLLCEDGARTPLSPEILTSVESPCSVVKQPWGAIVANSDAADNILASLRTWWPDGINTGQSWQGTLYNVLAPDYNARVVFLNTTVSPANFTSSIRVIPNIESISSCLPARRWCTISAVEQEKCNWVRSSSYSLGLQPTISCQQRADVFDCLRDIKEDKADFIALDSHYGYLARRHYQLSAVKLVQNNHTSSSRVAVMIKETSTANISRFENLRDKVACFPEYGGIAYVAFVRMAQQLDVISKTECNYAKAVGEFFSGACAPGALDEAHAISDDTSFNTTTLCSACRPRTLAAPLLTPNFTCAWDYNNLYYGNNGSLLCLSDPATDVAVLEMQNLAAHFDSLNLARTQYRALCANNTLSSTPGIDIPDNCLIANVVDSEVLTRRNSPIVNSLDTLLDSLEEFFGYSIAPSRQLINLHLYSPFDGTPDLLFKDSTIGLTHPSLETTNIPAKNYIELFSHLEGCTNDASAPGRSSRMLASFLGLAVSALLTRYVIY